MFCYDLDFRLRLDCIITAWTVTWIIDYRLRPICIDNAGTVRESWIIVALCNKSRLKLYGAAYLTHGIGN